MLKLLIFSPFIFLIACNSTEKSEKKDLKKFSKQAENQAVTEDDLILRLSADLSADTSTQAERDRNTIVNYAIDNLLDMKGTSSGLYYQILEEGQGDFIKWGDKINVHYKGYFLNGRVFDSSYKRNKPLNFYVGNMVMGWNEGLQLIKPGGKILLLIPSELAYAEKGFQNAKGKDLVPPNTNLAFEIEVLP